MRNPIDVWVHGQHVGILQDDPTGYLLTYDSDANPEDLVSLTMPVRGRQYAHTKLFPIFSMHLPEGYLRAMLTTHFAKITDLDDYGLLQLLSGSHVGRLQYGATTEAAPTPVTLQALISPSSEQLFQELLTRFALHSPISGVQPKVLAAVRDKTTWMLNPFIVKAWGPEYPQLALNEFYCMSVAKAAGIVVPEFHLSRDDALFIMKRFDLPDHAKPLGFEDFGVLHGRSNEDKYKGSYEAIAKTIGRYVSQANQAQAFLQYFRMIVVNQLVQNGDAHLKNFGILYRDPSDVWLAPAYDIINTTSYIRHDVPALTLGGKKQWVSAQKLIEFGVVACGLSRSVARDVYDQCRDAAAVTVTAIQDRLNRESDPTTIPFLTQLAARLADASA